MPRQSAGILLWRRDLETRQLEVLLVHPGGPFWAKKDIGAWSIPKGELADPESALDAAVREFHEETGSRIEDCVARDAQFVPLTPVKLKSGKVVHPFAIEGDIDASAIRSNTMRIEWPPRSGKRIEFPEVDRAEWFNLAVAREKLLEAQRPILDELKRRLSIA